MSLLVVGNAVEAAMDAIRVHLRSDATLRGLVTGIYEQLPEAAQTAYPYVRLSSPSLDNQGYGAMGTSGGVFTGMIDAWSDAKGPHAVRQILAQIKTLVERVDLAIAGHRVAGGSLTVIDERDFDEPDPDMPERRLWHGHLTIQMLIEES